MKKRVRGLNLNTSFVDDEKHVFLAGSFSVVFLLILTGCRHQSTMSRNYGKCNNLSKFDKFTNLVNLVITKETTYIVATLTLSTYFRNNEIVMPSERTGKVKDMYDWKVGGFLFKKKEYLNNSSSRNEDKS